MKGRYYASIVVFLTSLALLLLTLVDICRGFLFTHYLKIGRPSVLFNLNMGHLPMILVAGLGLWMTYRYWLKIEKQMAESRINLKVIASVMAIVMSIFLVIDLFVYRGIAVSRILASGKLGLGPGTLGMSWGIPVGSFPGWLQPAAEAVNYVLINWQATLLGVLIGSLFLVAGLELVKRMKGTGFKAHLLGAAVAIPQPFCACCASPVGSAMFSRGASLGPVLAFVVSAPMLNITGLILAATLLPTKFALLRIIGGVIAGVFLTYGVSLLASRWLAKDEVKTEAKLSWPYRWSAQLVELFNQLFRFETCLADDSADSPARLISSWLRVMGRLASVIVPVFLIGSIIVAYVVQVMPTSGNNMLGVIVTSFFSTLFMVPTWTEIPLASGLIAKVLGGLAAVSLIALPAVNIPSLVVIGGAFKSWKVPVALGLAVFAAGIVAGLIFL